MHDELVFCPTVQGFTCCRLPSPPLDDPNMLLRLPSNDLKLRDLIRILKCDGEDLDMLQRFYFELPDVSIDKCSSYKHLTRQINNDHFQIEFPMDQNIQIFAWVMHLHSQGSFSIASFAQFRHISKMQLFLLVKMQNDIFGVGVFSKHKAIGHSHDAEVSIDWCGILKSDEWWFNIVVYYLSDAEIIAC